MPSSCTSSNPLLSPHLYFPHTQHPSQGGQLVLYGVEAATGNLEMQRIIPVDVKNLSCVAMNRSQCIYLLGKFECE